MALFKKKGTQQLVPWEESMEVNDFSISLPDLNNGSPKAGDMIATNKDNPEDKWLVAKQFFNDNYEPANPISLSTKAEAIIFAADYAYSKANLDPGVPNVTIFKEPPSMVYEVFEAAYNLWKKTH